MHAPHHVAAEWVDPYRGRFDHGWDAWRQEIFARQLATGVVPEGTVLTDRPGWVDAWDELSADERRMHARQQEVFAGFLTHTDAQIGACLSTLAELGVLENTLVMLFSDNGASAEGGRHGQRERAPLHRPGPRVGGRQPGRLRRLGRTRHLQPLLLGMGLGRQHPAAPVEALHLAGRHAHAPDRPLAGGHRPTRRRADASSPTSSTFCRPSSRRSASRPRRRSTGSPSSRWTAPASSPPSPIPTPPTAGDPVLRDAGLAGHRATRAGRRPPTTCPPVSSTRRSG